MIHLLEYGFTYRYDSSSGRRITYRYDSSSGMRVNVPVWFIFRMTVYVSVWFLFSKTGVRIGMIQLQEDCSMYRYGIVTPVLTTVSWRWTLGLETCRRHRKIQKISLKKAHVVGLHDTIHYNLHKNQPLAIVLIQAHPLRVLPKHF
jgi:hypothetical protein